jgi:hypothetical protein
MQNAGLILTQEEAIALLDPAIEILDAAAEVGDIIIAQADAETSAVVKDRLSRRRIKFPKYDIDGDLYRLMNQYEKTRNEVAITLAAQEAGFPQDHLERKSLTLISNYHFVATEIKIMALSVPFGSIFISEKQAKAFSIAKKLKPVYDKYRETKAV